LASGRQLLLEQFSAVWAKFDTVACEMILENALSNAFKHGRSQNPDVSFTISAGERCNESQRVPIVFRVANRAHPDRPPLTEDFIQKLADQVPGNTGSGAVPALSDQVGLSHCFAIAKACGFALSLKQDDDLVIFEARVMAEHMEPPNDVSPDRVSRPLPPGLRFRVLDDSAVARRLVTHQLTALASPQSVKAFGATQDEVLLFLLQSVTTADVIIMDEHLQYSGAEFRGSDLMERFVAAGFQGLLCARSANCSETDIRKYVRSGAQCILRKEMSGTEMVETIADAYHRMKDADCLPSEASSRCSSVSETGML
jgi:CheY-like chemotaxis protein